jgi:hypothetical protein
MTPMIDDGFCLLLLLPPLSFLSIGVGWGVEVVVVAMRASGG